MKGSRGSQPTIYDVASLSGLSIATVSRVLNSPEKVNESTRSRVMAAIDQLGFVPKAEARARAMKSTGRIGVITPFFTAPAFVQRLRGVASALRGANYELIIYTIGSMKQLRSYLARLPVMHNLDGLIVISLQLNEEEARRLLENRLETVLIEYHPELFSSVEIDDVSGGQMAASFLLQRGHCRVAFLGDTDLPEFSINPISLRLVGFRKSLFDAGIDLPDEYIRLAPYSLDQTLQVARELLSLPEPPTAIFSATDFQAMGVLKAARALGLNVPGDLAVIGFDDLDWADYVGLTTVRQPLDESGKVAAELLLARMSEPERPVQHVQLPLSIIVRDTV